MGHGIAFLAGIFTVSGAAHFVRPEPFESIIPDVVPAKRELVFLSGAVELLCAMLLVIPPTRRIGGWLSAMLLVGVYPANVNMAAKVLRSEKAPLWYKIASVVRLPLQAPLIAIARRAARGL